MGASDWVYEYEVTAERDGEFVVLRHLTTGDATRARLLASEHLARTGGGLWDLHVRLIGRRLAGHARDTSYAGEVPRPGADA